MTVGIALALLTLCAFWGLQTHEFISFDDQDYISANPWVRAGITLSGVRWAFTTTATANWQPLTWLSHMLDAQLFGIRPGAHHAVTLVLHTANGVLLFLVLRSLTGALWRSALVAALFAVHPLHVESVAWASERKDVLSTLFWILTLGAYIRKVRRPTTSGYLLVPLLFSLGLMAKPMLVTLPFVLLLLDWWPLGRWVPSRHPGLGIAGRIASLVPARRLWSEKAPLFALAAVSSAITYVVQSGGGAVASIAGITVPMRFANTFLAYVRYLNKTFWPRDLASYYPYDISCLPGWVPMSATLIVLLLCGAVLALTRRFPYLATGWFWYLGTLVPVIGLVQVGDQALADRYTYLPLVGVFVTLAWGLGTAVTHAPSLKWLTCTGVVTGLVILVLVTRIQTGYWHDSIALYRHDLAVTTGNYMAHSNLGLALISQGNNREGIEQQRRAIELNPRFFPAYNDLGVALVSEGNIPAAIAEFQRALAINPRFTPVRCNLGNALVLQGRFEEAAAQFELAIRDSPDSAEAQYFLGVVRYSQSRFEEAAARFQHALRLSPHLAGARDYLGKIQAVPGKSDVPAPPVAVNPSAGAVDLELGNDYLRSGNLAEARTFFEQALRTAPRSAEAHYNLATALLGLGSFQEAIPHLRATLEINPNSVDAQLNLGNALAELGRHEEALGCFREAVRSNPRAANAQFNLGQALVRQGSDAEAIEHFRAATLIDPGDAEASIESGDALFRLNRRQEARDAYRAALRSNPSLPGSPFCIARHGSAWCGLLGERP